MKICDAIRRKYAAFVRFWNFHIRGKLPDRPFNGAFVHLPDGGLLWCPPVKTEQGPEEAPVVLPQLF